MPLPESRRQKLQMLIHDIAQGKVQSAAELLRGQQKTSAQAASDGLETAAAGDSVEPASLPAAGYLAPAASLAPMTLEQACPGCESAVLTAAGPIKHWLIRKALGDIAPDCLHIAGEYCAVLRGARQRFDELEASADLCHVANQPPEGLLFMDTETCGLSGNAIFLVGLMSWQDGQLVFEQLLARNYSEEPAILQAFVDRLAAAGVLVTFNGKAFDMNLIRERSAFHGVDLGDRLPPHLDLLHESRKRWRKRLPNCRLQTLERMLCKRYRSGDIPGSAIPQAYHDYVRTADARLLADILHHNLLDLLTMAQLVSAVLTGSDSLDSQA